MYTSFNSFVQEQRDALVREIELIRLDGDYDEINAENDTAVAKKVLSEILDKICVAAGRESFKLKDAALQSDDEESHGDVIGDAKNVSRPKHDLELDPINEITNT